MYRREYLALGGTTIAAAIAGCSDRSSTETPTDTSTAMDTATPTTTPTETPTETATETPSYSQEAAELLDEADTAIGEILDEYADVADEDLIVDVSPADGWDIPWFDDDRAHINGILEEALAKEYISDNQVDEIDLYQVEVDLIGSMIGIQRGLYQVHEDAQWLIERIQADNRDQSVRAAGDIGDALADEELGPSVENAVATAADHDVRDELKTKIFELQAEVETYESIDDAIDPDLEEVWGSVSAGRSSYRQENYNSAQSSASRAYDGARDVLDDLDMDPADNVADQYDAIWDFFRKLESSALSLEADAAAQADS